MAVNSPFPIAADLKPIAGIALGFAQAGIKKANRKDVLVMTLAHSATVAGVFTTNRFCAAPVQVCKAHLEGLHMASSPIRALVVNTGNANAGTGDAGLLAANAQLHAVHQAVQHVRRVQRARAELVAHIGPGGFPAQHQLDPMLAVKALRGRDHQGGAVGQRHEADPNALQFLIRLPRIPLLLD